MKAKVGFGLFVLAGMVATALLIRLRTEPSRPAALEQAPPVTVPNHQVEPAPEPQPQTSAPPALAVTPAQAQAPVPAPPVEAPGSTNKVQRLARIRETFHALAAGDPKTAMAEAKKLTDPTERETALLTLVTEWTQGELDPPQQRARFIAMYGLEAGLAMELIKSPELAVLWANELTEGASRISLLQQIASAVASRDPAAAFALSDQVPPEERSKFLNGVVAGWAANDTDAALQWANQLSVPEDRDAALQAIRNVAPIGIGAALTVQNGYPVINELIPGTPADLSGQLHRGDRIIGLAQGDNSFVDARDMSLQKVVQMIRGAPGTLLQLQVVSADAPPDSIPRTISIIRDQVKYKRTIQN